MAAEGIMETNLVSTDVGERIEPRLIETPKRKKLPGRFVVVAPLERLHSEALWNATGGEEHEHLWTYLFDGPFKQRRAFDEAMMQHVASCDPLYYAILDAGTGQAMGRAAYMRIRPVHRCIEVGSVLYSPEFQRSAGATEAMYLMARYVFEDLGYRRYEWKCNALNAPSRRAALRLGFTFEGIFRQHMIVKGRNRDTAWFSMLDSEWPLRKLAFERWLDPSNFDTDGRQKISLTAIQQEMAG